MVGGAAGAGAGAASSAISAYRQGFNPFSGKRMNPEFISPVESKGMVPLNNKGITNNSPQGPVDVPSRYVGTAATKTDINHNFPVSFEKIIIKGGGFSERLSDHAKWYTMEGYKNGILGVFEIGINKNGEIFHKNFVPMVKYLKQ